MKYHCDILLYCSMFHHKYFVSFRHFLLLCCIENRNHSCPLESFSKEAVKMQTTFLLFVLYSQYVNSWYFLFLCGLCSAISNKFIKQRCVMESFILAHEKCYDLLIAPLQISWLVKFLAFETMTYIFSEIHCNLPRQKAANDDCTFSKWNVYMFPEIHSHFPSQKCTNNECTFSQWTSHPK